MGLGAYKGREPLCNRRRWDTSLKKTFPELVLKDRCAHVVACEPLNSCVGNNECRSGYEYLKYQCQRKNDEYASSTDRSMQAKQYCRSDSDCRTRSGNPERKLSEACSRLHPEDCALCVNKVLTLDGSLSPALNGSGFGTCKCQPSRRCSLCTRATKFKNGSEIDGCVNHLNCLPHSCF